MTLDQYKLCPCGSGKKIKFCCSRDILADLERLDRMIQGEQRLAAVEKIDSLLRKYPDRPSLLMIKAEVELTLKELDKARETVKRLLEVAPTNPSVLALPAILAIIDERDTQRAVVLLQKAFSAVDGVVTARVYEAVMLVAMSLMHAGLPMAAKGHLQLALALSDAKDERCTSTLMQLNHSRSIPLVMREPLDLQPAPEDVTWKIEFETTMDEVYRGRWLTGSEQLSDMAGRILDAPAILWNLGVLSTWLGDNEKATSTFRSYARIRQVSMDQRVYAEALAQLLDPVASGRAIDIVGQSYPISDVDRLMEFCLSNERLRRIEPPAREGDEPPPKAAFDVLDKPLPENATELQVDQVPKMLATVLIYGKQTDRDARLEVHIAQTCDAASTVEYIKSWGGELIGEKTDELTITRVPRLAAEVIGQWRLPEGTTPEKQIELLQQLRRTALLEKWPQLPSPLYGDTSPAAAATESQYKIPLLAELLLLDITAEEGDWEVDFNELRAKLELPLREPLDADDIDLERLPVHDIARLDIPALNDQQLLTVYRRSYSVMAVQPLREAASELTDRPSLDDKIDKVEAYDILSDIASTTDEALEYLERARKLATAEGESPAQWLIDELEIRLQRGEVDIFVSLLKEIETRYIKEPGVGPMLMEVLARYGLVTPDGRVMVPRTGAPSETRQPEPAASTVWTPDAGSSPAPQSEEPKQESKLWVPGMD